MMILRAEKKQIAIAAAKFCGVAAAIGAATIATGLYSAHKQASAASDAAAAQSASASQGIAAQTAASQAALAQQQQQFDAIQKLLSPYVTAGTGALGQQQNMLGLNGANPQQEAIDAISNSPQFQSLTQQGENGILANASATGGLRGGNTQAALAQFRPQLLSQLIDQQYQRLGGLASVGENASAGVGNAGIQTGQGISANILGTGANVANLLGQQGSAIAGGDLAGGRAAAGVPNSILSGLGVFTGLGGKLPTTTPATSTQVGVAGGVNGQPVAPGATPGSTYGQLGSGFYNLQGF